MYSSRKTFCSFLESLPSLALVFIRNVCLIQGQEYLPHYMGQWGENTSFSKMRVVSPFWAQQEYPGCFEHPHNMLPGPSSISQKKVKRRQKDGLTLPGMAQSLSLRLHPFPTTVAKCHRMGKDFLCSLSLRLGSPELGISLLGALWMCHSIKEEVRGACKRDTGELTGFITTHSGCLPTLATTVFAHQYDHFF